MSIAPHDVSVVVQGPVVRDTGPDKNTNPTAAVLKSVRSALPGAEVILSTWVGSDLTGLHADRVVLSDDPGPAAHFIKPAQNVNRQIVSSANGLRVATRKYSVKLRSDTLIEEPNFLAYLDAFPDRDEQVSLYRGKIVASALGTTDPRTITPYSFFHLSDFFFFGLTEDVRTMFDIPLVGEGQPEASPIVSEQYIVLQSMEKKGIHVRLTGRYRQDWKHWLFWERVLVNNYITLHPSRLGILLPRRLYELCLFGYHIQRYESLYRTLCPKRTSQFRLLWRYWPLAISRYLAAFFV